MEPTGAEEGATMPTGPEAGTAATVEIGNETAPSRETTRVNTSPIGQAPRVPIEHQPPVAVGVPTGGKEVRCKKCGKINDNWVGSNWTESWSKHLDASAQNPESPFYGVGRRPTGEDGQDLITEAANAYGDASRAYEELLQRR